MTSIVSSTCSRIDMYIAYADKMFAHQGGWDEMLYAAVPILLIFGLLRLANTRAKRQVSEGAKHQEVDGLVSQARSADTETPLNDSL